MHAKQLWVALGLGIGLIVTSGAPSLAKDPARKEDLAASKAPSTDEASTRSQGKPSEADQADPKRRGALGVTLKDSDAGLHVSAVLSDGPAARAGIRVGDEITNVGASSIHTSQQLIAEIAKRQPGSQVELSIRRNGEQKTLRATLASPDTLNSAAQNRRIRELERQVSLLTAKVGKLMGNQRENWPSFQGAGDNSWYYQAEPDDPNQGIQDYGARARDGQ